MGAVESDREKNWDLYLLKVVHCRLLQLIPRYRTFPTACQLVQNASGLELLSQVKYSLGRFESFVILFGDGLSSVCDVRRVRIDRRLARIVLSDFCL